MDLPRYWDGWVREIGLRTAKIDSRILSIVSALDAVPLLEPTLQAVATKQYLYTPLYPLPYIGNMEVTYTVTVPGSRLITFEVCCFSQVHTSLMDIKQKLHTLVPNYKYSKTLMVWMSEFWMPWKVWRLPWVPNIFLSIVCKLTSENLNVRSLKTSIFQNKNLVQNIIFIKKKKTSKTSKSKFRLKVWSAMPK